MELTIEQRLKETENRLMFVMQTVRVQIVQPSGMFDSAGNPTGVERFNGNLLDLYMQQLQKAAEANEKKGNGHSGIII